MRNLTIIAALAALLAAGCEGLTLGGKDPGQDTYLGLGAIAVDPATDTAFRLFRFTPAQTEGESAVDMKTHLYAAKQGWNAAREVRDLTGQEDLRMLFPGDRILLMAESEGVDVLTTIDRSTFATLRTKTTASRYHGTRTSPSGRYVAVCDNLVSPCPIHVIDATTLESTIVPHDGTWLEMQWLNGSDRLVAIVFTGTGASAHARILAWNVEGRNLPDLKPDASGLWPSPLLDVDVTGVDMDMLFSFTWVGISPDDRYAVFPVRAYLPEDAPNAESTVLGFTYRLLVVDLADGSVRTVDRAQGPVGFTPDGSTIVSFRHDWKKVKDDKGAETTEKSAARLVLIDRATLAETEADLPFEAGPQYYVTREGNLIVATSLIEPGQVLLWDVSQKAGKTLSGTNVRLNEFVERTGHAELWILSDGLLRMDLEQMTLETVDLPWKTSHLNRLPTADRLVFDDTDNNRFVFFDPDAREVAGEVPVGQ